MINRKSCHCASGEHYAVPGLERKPLAYMPATAIIPLTADGSHKINGRCCECEYSLRRRFKSIFQASRANISRIIAT